MSHTVNLDLIPVLKTGVDDTIVAIKNTPAQLMHIDMHNKDAAVRFIQIFNVPAASVILGSTVPVLALPIPASGMAAFDFQSSGVPMVNGLSIACTTDETGSTGATIGATVNIIYK